MGDLFSLSGITFWVFQLINSLTASAMVFTPGRFHESMITNPGEAYSKLGFSGTALELLHNVIRGQGAALLAISSTLFYSGPTAKSSFLLIAFTCGLSFVAHIMTAWHHANSPTVMDALGDIRAIYPILGINLVLALSATWVFLS